MGSEKEDLQTISINFHTKGAKSREQLIHIKKVSDFIVLHETSVNGEPTHYGHAALCVPESHARLQPTAARRRGDGNPGRVLGTAGDSGVTAWDPAGTGPAGTTLGGREAQIGQPAEITLCQCILQL